MSDNYASKTKLPEAHLSILEICTWVFALVFLCWHYGPVLSSDQLAGWDLTSHLYLFTKMVDYLREGRFAGYDYNWYAGIPLFTLYPPLFYIAAALPCFLSGGMLNQLLAFNLAVFLLPIALIIGCWLMARAMFGARVGAAALLCTLLFLTLPRDTAHFAVGSLGLFAIGLPSSYMALALLALLVALMESTRANPRVWKYCGTAILVASLILTHLPISLFAAWLFGWYSLFRSGVSRWILLLLGLAGLALASWWWVPFLRHLPYSSGSTVGLPGTHPDPLLILFPGIFSRDLFDFLTLRLRYFATPFDVVLAIPEALLLFPWHGILLLAGVIAGTIHLLKQNSYFWPAFYLVSILLLPRNLLTEFTSIGLHTYRFIQPIYLFHIGIAALGLTVMGARLERLRISYSILLGIGLFITSFLLFTAEPSGTRYKNPIRERVATDLTYRLHLKSYFELEHAERIFEKLAELEPQGRVAADTSEYLFRRLGSPHFFTSQIPLQLNLPALPGLLAESALSAGFINPTLYRLSEVPGWTDYMLWGRNYLAGMGVFRHDTVDSMIRRLGLYGVEYIISALPSSQGVLSESNHVELVEKSGSFRLYRLKHFRHFVEECDYSPFLFVERGGMKFREFAEQWYAAEELLDRPVIFNPQDAEGRELRDQNRIGGFIVSWGGRLQPEQSDYEYWSSFGRPVIFLNASPLRLKLTSNQIHFFPEFSPWSDQDRFIDLMSGLPDSRDPKWTAVESAHISEQQMNLESHKTVLLNFSFAPNWNSTTAGQIIYWATPSSMLLFPAGKTELRYR